MKHEVHWSKTYYASGTEIVEAEDGHEKNYKMEIIEILF